jgi:hypothetical protein
MSYQIRVYKHFCCLSKTLAGVCYGIVRRPSSLVDDLLHIESRGYELVLIPRTNMAALLHVEYACNDVKREMVRFSCFGGLG